MNPYWNLIAAILVLAFAAVKLGDWAAKPVRRRRPSRTPPRTPDVLGTLCQCNAAPIDVVANHVNRIVRIGVRDWDCAVCDTTVYLLTAVDA
ncbi:MAG TPA: hypothetical protein VM286_04380 [Candidatus Thermoplasmatota archaeon]|nr:hypothetical protein [Candidatus Thermoplasmatota archaeon]